MELEKHEKNNKSEKAKRYQTMAADHPLATRFKERAQNMADANKDFAHGISASAERAQSVGRKITDKTAGMFTTCSDTYGSFFRLDNTRRSLPRNWREVRSRNARLWIRVRRAFRWRRAKVLASRRRASPESTVETLMAVRVARTAIMLTQPRRYAVGNLIVTSTPPMRLAKITLRLFDRPGARPIKRYLASEPATAPVDSVPAIVPENQPNEWP